MATPCSWLLVLGNNYPKERSDNRQHDHENAKQYLCSILIQILQDLPR